MHDAEVVELLDERAPFGAQTLFGAVAACVAGGVHPGEAHGDDAAVVPPFGFAGGADGVGTLHEDAEARADALLAPLLVNAELADAGIVGGFGVAEWVADAAFTSRFCEDRAEAGGNAALGEGAEGDGRGEVLAAAGLERREEVAAFDGHAGEIEVSVEPLERWGHGASYVRAGWAFSYTEGMSDVERDQQISCPKCAGRMARVVLSKISADRCESCGGVWFDALEKEAAVKDKAAVRELESGGHFTPTPAASAGKKLLCPRDHSTLVVMCDPNQTHVKFEACTVCGGAFLDRGELKDLASFNLLERLRHQFGGKKT